MKRTWVVHVGMGVGHELNNTISDSDWYGPYTQEQAEKLEQRLNEILEQNIDNQGEGLVATAMPLEQITEKALLARYQSIVQTKGDDRV